VSEPARIVEVGEKPITDREATAECILTTTPEACAHLVAGTRKGKPIEPRGSPASWGQTHT
jgi:molybdenum cofactor biosynthesis enzyme